jgi:hypothetical protein
MRILLVSVVLLAVSGCAKYGATCLDFSEGGHGKVDLSAGMYGDVVKIEMYGPSKLQRVPKDMEVNPCTLPS